MTAEQSRAARALLNWSRVRLGAKSNLSEETIREFENGNRIPGQGNLTRIRQALEAAGVVFTSGAPSISNLCEDQAGVTAQQDLAASGQSPPTQNSGIKRSSGRL
ncbi:helix-turn-helix transcriptional regulator [Mesorhizobium sp. M0152]